LRKILEEQPDDWNSQNQALKFLKAQTRQSSSDESITPTRIREEVESLIAAIRPDKKVKSELLFQELADKGNATTLDIEDGVVLSTESIQARVRRDSSQYRSPVGLAVADCWFQSRLELTTISDGTLTFDRCVFEQGIFAEGADIDKALRFINCVFVGGIALDMENASISGPLSLINCSFKGVFHAPRLRARDHVQLLGCGISASLSTISTPLTISQMMDRKWPDPEGEFEQAQALDRAAINLVGARIDGSLDIRANSQSNATVIYGSVNCDDILVGQSLNITGTSCEKAISFVRAQVSRLVDFSSLRILDGRLECSYAKVESDCRLLRTDVNGDVFLYQTTIGGNLELLGLKTAGDLFLSFAKVGAFVAAFHQAPFAHLPSLSVGGDLILSGAEAKAIELRGAEVAGKIQIIRGKFDELIMAVGAIPLRVDNPQIGNNHFQRLVPRPCRASVLEIASAQVQKLNVAGLIIELPKDERRAKRLRMNHEGGFLLENSKIGQNVTFFTERIRETLERRWQRNLDHPVQWHEVPASQDFGAKIWGNLILRSNQIDGGIDLRNIEVEGDIYLNDTSVGRDVDIDSGHPNFDGFRTNCNNFHAENLKCSGDLKLSGIRVGKDLRAKKQKTVSTKENMSN
jgi:hypothetical protein